MTRAKALTSVPSADESVDPRTTSIPLLRPFDVAREKVIAGWLRIAFFSSILFNHTVKVQYEFLDERMWLVWAQMLRDFGAIGFFVLAGVSLKGKVLARGHVKLPSNLLKLAIAATALAAFDVAYTFARGGEIGALHGYFYKALYDTNLWFFVAYAFAGPLLLALDGRGVFWTWICCLAFVMFPATLPLESPYILQTISLAFVCMAIGTELHGRQASPAATIPIAVLAFLARVWLDDYGYAVYPAIDILLRILYGTACFLLFKTLSDVICRRIRPPGWATYLFVPYVIQVPVVTVATVFATMLFNRSLQVSMQPIFPSFEGALAYLLTIFVLSLVMSFCIAWILRRYQIRV